MEGGDPDRCAVGGDDASAWVPVDCWLHRQWIGIGIGIGIGSSIGIRIGSGSGGGGGSGRARLERRVGLGSWALDLESWVRGLGCQAA
jgi:hypothetical protein